MLSYVKKWLAFGHELQCCMFQPQIVRGYVNTLKLAFGRLGALFNSLSLMDCKKRGLGTDNTDTRWEALVGYHEQKHEMGDTIILALLSPAVYGDIAAKPVRMLTGRLHCFSAIVSNH